MDIPVDKILPETCKRLLHQRSCRQITPQELDLECAHMALNCLNETRPHLLPAPPREIKDYYSMLPGEKKTIGRAFWEADRVKKYFGSKDAVIRRNKDSIYWLKRWKKIFLESGDAVNAEKMEVKIVEFKEWFFGEGAKV